MKKALINYIQNPKNDEIYTPEYAIKPLLKYILPAWKIWECTDFGNSMITKVLKENGNTVYGSHIEQGQNFLTYIPEFEYDCIITNPPYTLKTDFLKRAYELNTKFAFLLPITALESIERGKIYRQYNNELEVLVFDKRVEFYEAKNKIWFNTSWFCRGILPQQLIFVELDKPKR
jgi:hypothetical protein